MPTRIEWCDETINPLGHGCYGPGGTAEAPNVCAYCYARIVARRNMRGCELCRQFVPHAHFEQLDKLKRWRNPRNIFVQSMGDLFGEWVPDEWIQAVFAACEAAPWHRYLFLTKNPARVVDLQFKLPLPTASTFWYGFSHTAGEMFGLPAGIKRLASIEPLLGEVYASPFTWKGGLDWVIIGAQTGPGATKHQPRREWVDNVVAQCRVAGVPVFMKNSLVPIIGKENMIREFPWEGGR